MTTLVLEGVSLQDLDELGEATCTGDGNPAVALVTHAGCTNPSRYCANCVALLHEALSIERPGTPRTHVRCGAPITLVDLVVRPI